MNKLNIFSIIHTFYYSLLKNIKLEINLTIVPQTKLSIKAKLIINRIIRINIFDFFMRFKKTESYTAA
jgi:hypothetical protein